MSEREQPASNFVKWAAEHLPGATLTEFAAAKFAWQAALANRPERPVATVCAIGTWIAIEPRNAYQPQVGDKLYAAPVARPEPAQPLMELDGGYHRGLANGFDEAKQQTAQEPAQPVAQQTYAQLIADLSDVVPAPGSHEVQRITLSRAIHVLSAISAEKPLAWLVYHDGEYDYFVYANKDDAEGAADINNTEPVPLVAAAPLAVPSHPAPSESGLTFFGWAVGAKKLHGGREWRLSLSEPGANPETHALGVEIVPLFQRTGVAPSEAAPERQEEVDFDAWCKKEGYALNEPTMLRCWLAAQRVSVASQRLNWLHSPNTIDAEGYEWAVFRVKWANGKPTSVLHTLSDFSDLDAVILTAQPAKGDAA